MLHFTWYILLVLFANPAGLETLGLHQTIGTEAVAGAHEWRPGHPGLAEGSPTALACNQARAANAGRGCSS